MININSAVANGAAWLDKVNPGWERQINLEILDLSQSCRCVLGQVVAASVPEDQRRLISSGGWVINVPTSDWAWSGYEFVSRLADDYDCNWLYDHGFETVDGQYPALDEAWIALIKQRFELDILSDTEDF